MVAPVDDDGANPLSNIIKLVTQSRNSSKGPTLFIFKAMLVSTTSAMIFGLGAGLLAPSVLGPGFSTVLGMGSGFVGGLVHRWRSDLSQAANALDEYPELMKFHIRQVMMNVQCAPAKDALDMEEWRADLSSNVRKQSLAIAAVYSASDALEAIRRHQEEQIMERYMARAAETVSRQFGE